MAVRKRGAPKLPSRPIASGTGASRDLRPAGARLILPAFRQRVQTLILVIFPSIRHAGDLEIGLPDAARLVVRVRDVVAEGDALAADVAAISLDLAIGQPSDQLDARHLGAVALAVSGLENARVAAGARSRTWVRFPGTACRRSRACGRGGRRDGARAACRSCALVISFSTNGRSSLAFASVVSIAPCSMSDVARFRIRASFCSLVRRSCRPAFR